MSFNICLFLIFCLATTVNAAAGSARISSTAWSNQVDDNHNGCFEAARLNWNPDVSGGGTLSVYEIVYFRTNNNNWTPFFTNSVHVINGTDANDTQFVQISEGALKPNCTLYDYRIEIYRDGIPSVDAFRDPSNDVNLTGHAEEGLPDLIAWAPSMQPYVNTTNYSVGACAVQHGCVQPGSRRLLRFGTEARNIGTADMVLGNPTDTNSFAYGLFVYDPCHGHYHFDGFANYTLLDGNSQIAAGNKLGFCLEDWSKWDPNAPPAKYTCSNQGIQAGWADLYWGELTCQWIDITGVPPGTYTLQIELNPAHLIKESNYANNISTAQVTIENTPPTISDIPNQSAAENTSTAPISFTVWDGETVWDNLLITPSSSNPTLVPNGNIHLGGSGQNRTITITPALNQSGTSTITVTVEDGYGGAASDTFTLAITSANSAPVISISSVPLTYTEDDAPTIIDPTANVSDVDSSDLNAGSLTVDFTSNGAAEDRLAIRNQGTSPGQIGKAGSNVTYGGAVIGTYTGGTSGSTPLVIAFTGTAATPAAAQALTRSITYSDVSGNPSTLPRTVRFLITDGDSGTSAPASRTINILAVNDPPMVGLPSGDLTYTANDPPTIIDPAASASDVDSDIQNGFLNGSLRVEITANGAADDRLSIRNQGAGPNQIGLDGLLVTYAGLALGTFTGGTSGSSPLVVGFSQNPSIVSVSVVQALIRSILYQNLSSHPSTLPRTVAVVLMDGSGGSSAPATKMIDVVRADTDGDGIPDDFEIANGLDPSDPSDASKDSDGDGFSALQEFLAGTDPFDPASAPAITETEQIGADIRISFRTVLGKHYRIERTENFPAGPWVLVETKQGTGGVVQANDVGAGNTSTCLYRVQVLP